MPTATATRRPASAPDLVDHAEHNQVENLQTTAERLRTECMEVTFLISWISKQKKVDREHKQQMVDVVDGNAQEYGVYKRLFSTKHPAVKGLEEAKRRLISWRNAWTILKGAAFTSGESGGVKIEPGKRLIRTQDIERFEEGFRTRVEDIREAARRVERRMDEIREIARQAQGKTYEASDYPDDISQRISVTDPVYGPIDASTQLPREVYQRECERVTRQMTASIEATTISMCNTLTEGFETLVKEIGNRVRIRPAKGHPLRDFYDAEVIQVITAQMDESLGTNQVKLELRRKTPRRKTPHDKPQPSKPVIVGPMPVADYESANARATDERRRIADSVVNGIVEQIETFRRLGSLLGDHGQSIDSVLDRVEATLREAGGRHKLDGDHLADELRNAGQEIRKQVQEDLEVAVTSLQQTALDVTNVRRRLDSVGMRANQPS